MGFMRQKGLSPEQAASRGYDATHVVQPIEHVETTPPPETDLADDPHFSEQWSVTLEHLRAAGSRTDEDRAGIIANANLLRKQIDTELGESLWDENGIHWSQAGPEDVKVL